MRRLLIFTQVPSEYRHSGMDAGIQAHGCEGSKTPVPLNKAQGLKVTVHGTGYRHPCRYDGPWTNVCTKMSEDRVIAIKHRGQEEHKVFWASFLRGICVLRG
jgi:hypothetical protein